jgi:hypothetical protein
MKWWTVEIIQLVALVALAFSLHRVIRRSGESYAAELFSSTPEIGRRFLLLADIAFYLIFAAYTLFNLQLHADVSTVGAGEFEAIIYSVAGIALIIGVLHLVNVVFLPLISNLISGRGRSRAAAQSGQIQERVGSLLLTVTVDAEPSS